jgi:hypothetical protein
LFLLSELKKFSLSGRLDINLKNSPALNSPKGWKKIEIENPVINPLGSISPKNAKNFLTSYQKSRKKQKKLNLTFYFTPFSVFP